MATKKKKKKTGTAGKRKSATKASKKKTSTRKTARKAPKKTVKKTARKAAGKTGKKAARKSRESAKPPSMKAAKKPAGKKAARKQRAAKEPRLPEKIAPEAVEEDLETEEGEDEEGLPYEALGAEEMEGAEEEDAGEEIDYHAEGAVPSIRAGGAQMDALSAYMQEASRHPILTREQEHDLAVEWKEQGDTDAARALIEHNLRLVVKIAWEYRSAHRNLLDLVQEGNIGLMMAVKNFDPYKGVRLSSYAQYWIRAYILRYIINNFHLVKIGTTQAQRKLFFNLRKEKERLEREGFVPSTKLLADRLNVKEEEVREMDQRLSGGEVSMETPVGGGEDGTTTLEYFLADESEPVSDQVADEEQMARFRKALEEYRKTLSERDGYIFDKRLISENPLTLEEIGTHFGVSKERARQLEERIKNNLRKFLDERGHEFSI